MSKRYFTSRRSSMMSKSTAAHHRFTHPSISSRRGVDYRGGGYRTAGSHVLTIDPCGGSAAVSRRELTTVLTTTMTTVGLPDTSTYTIMELASRLVAPSARAYGSEGWGFESLRAHPLALAPPGNHCGLPAQPC